MAKPQDYTLERARVVYGRDEFTRWLLQGEISDPELPPYLVDFFARRGDYIVFLHGYVDADRFRLAWSAIGPKEPWWDWILETIKAFYLESKFYGWS